MLVSGRVNGRQLYGALQLRNLESPGLALELPAEWVEGILAATVSVRNENVESLMKSKHS